MAIMTAGCTHFWSVNTPPLTDGEAAQVTQAMVSVLADAWPPTNATVAVAEHNGWRSELVSHLRQTGYGVAAVNAAPDTLDVDYAVNRVGELDIYHAVLSIGPSWRVERLYGRDRSGALIPTSAFTVLGQSPYRATAANPLSTLATMIENSPANGPPTLAGKKPPFTAASSTEQQTSEREISERGAVCDTLTMAPGSLRSNIARLLQQCGYRLGEWRFGDAVYLEDWVIPARYSMAIDGLTGLLAWLERSYGVAGKIRPGDRTVDFAAVKTAAGM